MPVLLNFGLGGFQSPGSFMASKAIYTVIGVVGIAAASTIAWWYQQPRSGVGVSNGVDRLSTPGSESPLASASAPAGQPPSVEVAKVEVARLTDNAGGGQSAFAPQCGAAA